MFSKLLVSPNLFCAISLDLNDSPDQADYCTYDPQTARDSRHKKLNFINKPGKQVLQFFFYFDRCCFNASPKSCCISRRTSRVSLL